MVVPKSQAHFDVSYQNTCVAIDIADSSRSYGLYGIS